MRFTWNSVSFLSKNQSIKLEASQDSQKIVLKIHMKVIELYSSAYKEILWNTLYRFQVLMNEKKSWAKLISS
jgi:hypothetical protein